jgi:hypothetical protein
MHLQAPKLVAIAPGDEPQPSPAEVVLRAKGPVNQFTTFLRYAEARLPPDAAPRHGGDRSDRGLGTNEAAGQSSGDHGDEVAVNLR